MNILYVSFDEVPSFKGASMHILSGLREVIKKHTVILISLGETTLPASPNFFHLPIVIAERNYLKRGLLFRDHVEKFISRNKVDIIHFRGPFEGLPAIRSGIPCLYEVNAFPSIELEYHYGTLPIHVKEHIASWERECLLNANQIITPSNRTSSCIYEHCPQLEISKTEVLQNGYDRIGENKNVFGLNNTLRGLYLGTLSPWQGMHWALKAIRDLVPNFSVDIYAPYQKIQFRRMERRIQRYKLDDNVKLFNAIDSLELSKVIPQYDFALAPLMKTDRNTKQGCCPLKIIEYLRYGVPTIAPDLFVVREIIKSNEYPFLYHPNSIVSLKEALKKLFEFRHDKTIRNRAQSILDEHMTWREYSLKLLVLYENIQRGVNNSTYAL